uniref:Nucleolar protein 8 n=1 Tax=Naja naja TaxID=35670 RepID=A0A8C6V3Y8_NAJNA
KKINKRLYIGGLGHSVSEDELYERFSKFGNVTETEIISRKDEHGNPTKTFAYLNILLSEKELKKCISVLNKTKWKGGTLQIELAKESFLHRKSFSFLRLIVEQNLHFDPKEIYFIFSNLI